MWRKATNGWLMILVLGIVASIGFAQEPATQEKGEASKSVSAREKQPIRARLPNYFAQIGLSRSKAEEIRKVAYDFDKKIADLRQEIEKLLKEKVTECEKMLNDDQLAALKKLRDEAAARKSKRGRPPAEPASDSNSPNDGKDS